MSSTSAPFGFEPIYHPSGQIRALALPDGIASGYAADIFAGTPVLMATTGTLQSVTSGSSDFVGVFAGVTYQPAANQRPIYQKNWVSGTTYVAGTMTAYYYEDPLILYRVQSDGSIAATAVGDQANVTNFVAGNTTTGLSAATLSSTLAGAGTQGQWRIIQLAPQVNNAWGDAYTVVNVQIARHQFVSNKVAV